MPNFLKALVLIILSGSFSVEEHVSDHRHCLNTSRELKALMEADQKERENFAKITGIQRHIFLENDLARRKRVGEIFGEGCLKTPRDYLNAALIYQHGEVSDHYYQAFIWANRALSLGEDKASQFVVVTIDRYLVSIGHKQLFGSQAYWSAEQGNCYCLQSVEESYPDEKRKAYCGFSLAERYEWLASLNKGSNCPQRGCLGSLKPSPVGTVPGFW